MAPKRPKVSSSTTTRVLRSRRHDVATPRYRRTTKKDKEVQRRSESPSESEPDQECTYHISHVYCPCSHD